MTMIEIKKPMINKRQRSDDNTTTTTMASSSSSSSRHDGEENLGGYECKTCGKRFKSFQALGGHQGIHKKMAVVKPSFDELCELRLDIIVKSFSGLHRCKQCAKEFDSGQALGGHMRRHRRRAERQQPEEASNDQQADGKSDLTTVVQEPAEEVSRRPGLIIKAEDDRIMMMRSELMLAATEWRLSIL